MTDHDEKFSNLLVELDAWFKVHHRGVVSRDGMFLSAIRASLTKSFEFFRFCRARANAAEIVFTTATLRGVCEDIITLCFIQEMPVVERDVLIEARLCINIRQGLAAQQLFFQTSRPWQPVVGSDSMSSADAEAKVEELARRFGWPRGQWPTVRHMARASGLGDLYDYLYAATSEWVHFSPHILLRMGWGGGGNHSDVRDTEMAFSTSHFSEYYKDFTRTYSLYLLALGLRRLAPMLDNSFDLSIADQLDQELARSMRWPELITFEELNLKPPSMILTVLARAIHERVSASPPPSGDDPGDS